MYYVTMPDQNFLNAFKTSTNPLGVLSDALWCPEFTKFHKIFFFKNCLNFRLSNFGSFCTIKNDLWMKKPAILEEKYFMKFVNKRHHGASLGAPRWFIGTYIQCFSIVQSRILHSEMIFIFFDLLVLELFFRFCTFPTWQQYVANSEELCARHFLVDLGQKRGSQGEL